MGLYVITCSRTNDDQDNNFCIIIPHCTIVDSYSDILDRSAALNGIKLTMSHIDIMPDIHELQ